MHSFSCQRARGPRQDVILFNALRFVFFSRFGLVVSMELLLETKLSQKPNVEPNDTTALTKEQQDRLNQHKVLLVNSSSKFYKMHWYIP